MSDTMPTVEDVMTELGTALRENVLLQIRVRKLEAAFAAASKDKECSDADG
jgi:hypothetical protein